MPNSNPHPQSWAVMVQLLREIAEQKGITQDHIAEQTGITRNNISRIFSLKYRPRLDIFLAIAKAIEVNVFFEDRESKTDLSKAFEKAMTAIGRRPDNLPGN